MPYTAGQADMTVGPRIAAEGIQSATSSLSEMMQKIGFMHLQDQQGGAILDAYKAAGYFDKSPGPNGTSMLPGPLYSAAQKGPLGTKFAISQTLGNYLQMNYQMNLAKQKYMYEQNLSQGGLRSGGGGGQGNQTPSGDGGQSFDLKNPPPGQGMNAVPWNPTGSSDQAN